ncbi:MAG: methyltransferase domain-containing protein [Solidesulfovibrio sp.]
MTSTRQTVVVQASSRSFGGGPDMCVNIAAGRPVVVWTMDRVRETFGDVALILAAPAFDTGSALSRLAEAHGATVVCAHDESPLARLVLAVEGLPDEAVIVRVDGLHFGFYPELARRLVATAQDGGHDLVKAPDDYPVQLTVDAYRVGALRRLAARTNLGPVHHVHPKYYMLNHPEEFSCLRLGNPPRPDDAELLRLRHFAHEVYDLPRLEVFGHAVAAGNQWIFHYELALPLMERGWTVLDVACGQGYGAGLLATRAGMVVAADLAPEALDALQTAHPLMPAVQADATQLGFGDATFDAVVSFETIEHVDDQPYLAEMHRVLKPGGLFVMSTPQNSLGHIPINAQHVREYSLKELTQTLSRHFEITRVIGIKQGRVVAEGDPLGQNTVVFCRKPAAAKECAK